TFSRGAATHVQDVNDHIPVTPDPETGEPPCSARSLSPSVQPLVSALARSPPPPLPPGIIIIMAMAIGAVVMLWASVLSLRRPCLLPIATSRRRSDNSRSSRSSAASRFAAKRASHGRVLTPASPRRSRGYPLPVLP